MAKAGLGMQELHRREGVASGVSAALVRGACQEVGAVSVSPSPFTVKDSTHSGDHVTHRSGGKVSHEGQAQTSTQMLCSESIHSRTPRLSDEMPPHSQPSWPLGSLGKESPPWGLAS